MPNSLQGLQNQLFAIFMLLTIFSNFAQQILPHFVTQRALYEVRERPSKTYSWQVFILSNILVEIPWNTLMAVLVFVGWYYPIGLRQNAVEANQVAERGALMFLFILAFLIFSSTFTHMVIAGVETAEAAGNITNLMFSLTLIFCGYVNLPSYISPKPTHQLQKVYTNMKPQRPGNPRRPSRLLDLYVSGFSPQLSSFGHVVSRSRQLAHLLLH
jgi:ATP-binding cassette subfamily G (WHITE) protein 2 (PDR)